MSADIDRALRRVALTRIRDGLLEHGDDLVIDETPIALTYNGVAHAVMMATARDLQDFALGFSLSEGIVAAVSEWQFVEARRSEAGIVIEMLIPQSRFDALQQRPRQLVGNSACGLCGVESLQSALRPLAPIAFDGAMVRVAAIEVALQSLSAAQLLNQHSGGVHAAGWAHAEGLLVREDVGRHNALDKLLGARAGMVRNAVSAAGREERFRLTPLSPLRGDPGFVVVSSRASYELVHKTASAGIPLLATVSAPTSAAIDLAQACGLTLIAFAREGRMNLYTHGQRVSC